MEAVASVLWIINVERGQRKFQIFVYVRKSDDVDRSTINGSDMKKVIKIKPRTSIASMSKDWKVNSEEEVVFQVSKSSSFMLFTGGPSAHDTED